MRNLITDVPGVLVGSADEAKVSSGVTVVIFERPAVAGVAMPGGAPALRDSGLLAPEMTVETVDAFVLSGGSAFGLEASNGAMAWLAERGRGFVYGNSTVPIAPGAALFDLANGGDKSWGRRPPYAELAYTAAGRASHDFALGTVGAGFGATTSDLKGGLGSASAATSRGFVVGALAAVNAAGGVTRGAGPYFWAAPFERGAEFGGRGLGAADPGALSLRLKTDQPANTTLIVVATDAPLSKGSATRLAIMASGGIALAMRPAFGPADGDIVFAASTARATTTPDLRDLTEIGMLAADCVARAVARAVYEASPLVGVPRWPSWRQLYG